MGALGKVAWLAAVWTFTPVGNDPSTLLHRAGKIQVWQDRQPGGATAGQRYNYLMRSDSHFGLCFLKPPPADHGKFEKDFSRLPTTYHHRNSPVGRVMEQFNWFHPPDSVTGANTFSADARLTTSVVGLGPDAFSQLLNLWSEPPYGVVGMNVGGMAAYARPGQWVDFYENNPEIIKLSLPDAGGKRYFEYIQDAKDRGAVVRVFKGDERSLLRRRGPDKFYHVLVVEMSRRDRLEDISVESLTKEAMALYFRKLTEEGVLCLHVSHRYTNVVPVVADVADSLGLVCLRVSESGPLRGRDHSFGSEWVLVVRKREYLERVTAPPNIGDSNFSWDVPAVTRKHVWTDKGPNSLRGLVLSDPRVFKLRGILRAYSLRLDQVLSLHRQVYNLQYRAIERALSAIDRLLTRARNEKDIPAESLAR
jgi:hypothetical protein